MKMALAAFCGVLLLYIGYRIYALYDSTQGTIPERLYATAKGSRTIFMAMVSSAGLALFQVIDFVAQMWATPETQDMIKAWVTPQTLTIVGLVITGLTIWSRMRTLPKAE